MVTLTFFKIIVAFYDSREAAKLYGALHINSFVFRQDSSPVQLHCLRLTEAFVEHVRRSEQFRFLLRKAQTIGRGEDYDSMRNGSDSVIVVEIIGNVETELEYMKVRIFRSIQRRKL